MPYTHLRNFRHQAIIARSTLETGENLVTRPRLIPVWALVGSLLAPLPAGAQCLTGPGSTGMETGTQTLSVLIKNVPPQTILNGSTCGPAGVLLDPGIAGASTGGRVCDRQ